jgi:hypothetical protein
VQAAAVAAVQRAVLGEHYASPASGPAPAALFATMPSMLRRASAAASSAGAAAAIGTAAGCSSGLGAHATTPAALIGGAVQGKQQLEAPPQHLHQSQGGKPEATSVQAWPPAHRKTDSQDNYTAPGREQPHPLLAVTGPVGLAAVASTSGGARPSRGASASASTSRGGAAEGAGVLPPALAPPPSPLELPHALQPLPPPHSAQAAPTRHAGICWTAAAAAERNSGPPLAHAAAAQGGLGNLRHIVTDIDTLSRGVSLANCVWDAPAGYGDPMKRLCVNWSQWPCKLTWDTASCRCSRRAGSQTFANDRPLYLQASRARTTRLAPHSHSRVWLARQRHTS